MDQVLEYLETWRRFKKEASRIQLLAEAYSIVRDSGRLKGWRFSPGRLRPGSGGMGNPMHCAFAATPFEGDDWFILRLVMRKPDYFSIGFCPDYGKQDPKSADYKPYTERRRELYKALSIVKFKHPDLLRKAPFPEPNSPRRPHAFKGLECQFLAPATAQELADLFIDTVTEWANLFKAVV